MSRSRRSLRLLCSAFLALAAIAWALPAGAQVPTARDEARRLYDRLVGVPPGAAVLDQMEALVASDQALDAAEIAMQARPFYTVALKNFITPWTNVERTVFADLNDYTATVIGIIRDDVDFRQVLQADILYQGAPGTASAPFSLSNNDHYRQLEANRVDLSNPALLVQTTQSGLPGSVLGPTDAAGVLTTRAAGEAFFKAGTNRRMLRFTAINYLCRDLEQLKDVSRPADRIRQDVSRSPGGDSEIFHTQCVGCHSGMDPMAGAFAYFEWSEDLGRVLFTPGLVQPKYLINANTFAGGYVTTDDRWDNFWRAGANASLGWRGPLSGGYGAKTFGQEIAESRAFSVCQVEKVFQQVCFRPPRDDADVAAVQAIADAFEAEGYRMKTVFARVAVHCMGD